MTNILKHYILEQLDHFLRVKIRKNTLPVLLGADIETPQVRIVLWSPKVGS